MLEEIVLSPRWQVNLDHYEVEENTLVLSSQIVTTQAACPICNSLSSKVHSSYTRQLADLPVTGHTVRIHLAVKRFFCINPSCSRKTFVQQLPLFMQRYARRTNRQHHLLTNQAFALGGEPGSREAKKMGINISGDTLLRYIRKTSVPARSTPRVLGVDDWAYRKGVEYGSILVDLEQHCPVELLPDRKSESLAKWLENHPGVEIVSRDRASAYADGARRGAPQAIQVADRFHLLKNLGDHLKNMFERKSASLLVPQDNKVSQEIGPGISINLENLKQTPTIRDVEPDPQSLENEQPATQAEQQNSLLTNKVSARKSYLFDHIKALSGENYSQRFIATELKISRQTVKKYLVSEKPPRYTPRSPRPSKLDLYKPYLAARWREGIYKGVDLFLEIKERGYTGSWPLLANYLTQYRKQNPPIPVKPKKDKQGRTDLDGGEPIEARKAKLKPQPMLSARQAAWIMTKKPEDLTAKDQTILTHLRAFDTEVEAAFHLSQEFLIIVRERQGQKLEEWLKKVELRVAEEQLMELGSFSNGIRKDQAAVTNGLILEFSQGQTEGQVNRLKTLKRTMYGRAKFDLLRARVLHSNSA